MGLRDVCAFIGGELVSEYLMLQLPDLLNQVHWMEIARIARSLKRGYTVLGFFTAVETHAQRLQQTAARNASRWRTATMSALQS